MRFFYEDVTIEFMQWFSRSLWSLLLGNPIFIRIIQSGSRRSRDAWVRMIYLGVLIFLVFIALASGRGLNNNVTLTELAKSGTQVFAFIAYGQVILIGLLSPLFMARAIEAEQAAKTFDITLTTPLSNLQIILGSLFGRLFFILALLASGLPLFSVMLIFGGVPISAVLVSFATAGLTALVVGTVAVALSVLRIGGRKAVINFVVVVMSYLIGAYFLDYYIFRRMAITPNGTTFLTPLHPLLVLETWLNHANYHTPLLEDLAGRSSFTIFYFTHPFTLFSMVTLGISSLLIGWCSFQVRRIGQGQRSLWFKLMQLIHWRKINRGERHCTPRMVWENPIAWREANTRGRITWRAFALALFVIGGLFAAAALIYQYHHQQLPTLLTGDGQVILPSVVFRNTLTSLILIELLIIGIATVYTSASSVSKDREDRVLDLILATPLSGRRYLLGKIQGMVRGVVMMLGVPILTLAMVGVYVWIGQHRQWPTANSSYVFGKMSGVFPLILPEAGLLFAVMMIPFMGFCMAIALAWSVKSSRVLKAVVACLFTLGLWVFVLAEAGSNLAREVVLIGPMANSFSPMTNVQMLINPWEHVANFMQSPQAGRNSLWLGACLASFFYSIISYLIIGYLIRNFDRTVRHVNNEA